MPDCSANDDIKRYNLKLYPLYGKEMTLKNSLGTFILFKEENHSIQLMRVVHNN